MAKRESAKTLFLRRLDRLEGSIGRISGTLRHDVGNLFDQYTRGDEIVNRDKLETGLKYLLSAYVVEISDTTIDANVDVARIQANEQFYIVNRALKESGLSTFEQNQLFRNFRNQIMNYPSEILKRITTRKPFDDGISMPYRFKSVFESGQKTVRNILDLGLKNRESSAAIASKIKEYIRPSESSPLSVAPKAIQRERFGLSDDAEVRVRGGSMDYNAIRIARTETQRTFRAAPEELNAGKAWVQGFQWNLSLAHPFEDTCDDIANADDEGLGEGVYSTVPDSHPNCICYVTTVLISNDELQQLFVGEEVIA